MCGIGGIIGEKSSSSARKIIEKLLHRGPDSNDYWISDEGEFPVTMCHTRLSIIDLSEDGSQPFFSEDQRYVLVFNGEIFNYIELKEELQKKGCFFKTRTDTEVLLKGLILEGPEFQLKCNGMWSFCLWDRESNKALFGRDRFGIKPLYYYQKEGLLIFGSEMKSITPFIKKIEKSNNFDSLTKSIFNYESTEECVIKGIKRLRAGNYLIFENKNIIIKRYWNTLDHIDFTNKNYEEQVEDWKYLFLDSVKLRMRSDVSIGSALSGGLDSSSVVAAMNHISENNRDKRFNDDWQHLFCSSFPGSINDETKWAEKVADNLSLPLNKLVYNPSSYSFNLEQSIAMVEDPYLTVPLPMLFTYREIKRNGINVTLDGHGSDELFSGYGHIKKAISATKNKERIKELMAIEASLNSGIYSPNEKKLKRKWVKYKLKEIIQDSLFGSYKIICNLPGNLFNRFRLSPSYFDNELHNHPVYIEMDSFSQVLFDLFHYSFLPTLLRNYDKYSMASGVEIRMPFMDWRLVCNTFSIPTSSKLGGSFIKRIQRDSLKNILVDDIRLRRDKIGWNAPSHDWFRSFLKVEIDSILKNSKNSKYFKSSLKAWNYFHNIQKPTFEDGHETWMKLLPLIWENSLNNKIWK